MLLKIIYIHCILITHSMVDDKHESNKLKFVQVAALEKAKS